MGSMSLPTGERFLSVRDVAATTGMSKSWIYREMRRGAFPENHVITRDRNGEPRRVAWLASDVFEWMKEHASPDDARSPASPDDLAPTARRYADRLAKGSAAPGNRAARNGRQNARGQRTTTGERNQK